MKKINIKKTGTIIGAICVGLVLTAGSCDGTPDATDKDEQVAADQLAQFQLSQPVPQFNYSQLRQNLIEIETAQANGSVTTSFMFLMGSAGTTGPMLYSCPSVGFPIPATFQITNPMQTAGGSNGASYVWPQLEANGVYTGDTTGTYVMCIGDDGKPFAFYWEGFVATVTGPAHWDNTKGEIVMDGTSSTEFTGLED